MIIRKARRIHVGCTHDRLRFAWFPLRLTSGAWIWLEGVREHWTFVPQWDGASYHYHFRMEYRAQAGGAW